jgi:hypothetical protein
MKRKTVVKTHLIATVVAILTITTFFSLSLIAEIRGEESFIKTVKAFILYGLPVLIFTMPTLKITGDKLAGKSTNPLVLEKVKRMKIVVINGVGLILLAVFLYYRSHYKTVDDIFLFAQTIEFGLGLANLSLIILNARSGLRLSGKLK